MRADLTFTRASADDLVRDLDSLVFTQGEPFGSTSIYAQNRVFRLARDHGVTVMLDGQGADELFAGYPSLVPARCTALIRQGRPMAAAKLAVAAARGQSSLGASWHLARGVAALLPSPVVAATRAALGQDLRPPWLDKAWLEQVDFAPTTARWRNKSLREAVDEAFWRTSLPALLRYEDRNSMAYSIESRVPFLDQRLVEFVHALPERFLIGANGSTKSVFRAAMRGLVPDEILDRRDKLGFETPEHTWLPQLQGWVTSTLGSEAAHSVTALNPTAVRHEYESVVSGRKPFGWHLWRCLNTIRWSELFNVHWA